MGWCADFVLGETGALQFLLHWRPAELALTPSASCNHIPGHLHTDRGGPICTYAHVFVSASSAQDSPLHHLTGCPTRAQMRAYWWLYATGRGTRLGTCKWNALSCKVVDSDWSQ